MDRPSQQPPERPGPPSEAGESPLSFPAEVGRPADPLDFPAAATAAPADPLAFPSPATAAPADPLDFPAATTSVPAGPLDFPAAATAVPADPPAFPAEAGRPVDPLDFPSAATAVPADPLAFPAEAGRSAGPLDFPAAATASPADPLAFPTEAARPTDPLAFPSPASPAPAAQVIPPPAEQLPFPVAEIPGSVTALPPPATHATQPAEPAPTPVTEPATPSGLLRFLPPVLAAVAAVMVAGGCVLPLFRLQENVSVRQRFFEAQVTITETAWGGRIEIPGQDAAEQGGAPLGFPLILAALLLAVAAFTAFARPGRGPGRGLIGAGALFTAGVVTTVGMGGPGWSAMADGMNLEVVVAAGMWVLIGATVLAAVAAVLAYLPAWRRTGDDWADPSLAYADTPTPPTGVAITVLPPEEPG